MYARKTILKYTIDFSIQIENIPNTDHGDFYNYGTDKRNYCRKMYMMIDGSESSVKRTCTEKKLKYIESRILLLTK